MPDKTNGLVQTMFSEVHATYEVVNHIMTLGLDIVWRRRAARIAATADGDRWIDMCTGTGEMVTYLSHLAPKGTKIYAVDFSAPMLEEARMKPGAQPISFISSDIKGLPFPDESFNLITMSFATRNINISRNVLVQSFTEFHRVLNQGGRFVNLETSRPPFSPIRIIFDLYIKLFVELIGSRISSSRTPYIYLANTLSSFYHADELADIMRQAGFGEVTFQRLFFGAVAIHQAMKL
jgi:demethylmenaquinone methyltransferase/2-methoxy-6-polyprenyl-1,4-benzoquinol methylase